MDALQAITRSISHNEIVTVSLDKAGIEELEALCDDSVDVSGERDRIEFWGTNTDGEHWRVHVMTGRYTLIEYMPAQHRESHLAAGNDGRYPHNGAVRVYVEGDVDARQLDARWTSIIKAGLRELPQGEATLSEVPAEAYASTEDS